MKLRHWLGRLCGQLALEHGIAVSWWRKLGQPDGSAWANYLQRHGRFYAMGEGCVIQTNVVITDPAYVRMGSNVHLSGCTLFCHDGVVNMLRTAYGHLLDKVGGIDIGDNVFVGHQAIIMPGVRIGSNTIVAAGALVTRDVPAGSMVGGVPAKPIGTVDQVLQRLTQETASLPWLPLLQARQPGDPPCTPALDAQRVAHFFTTVQGGSHVH